VIHLMYKFDTHKFIWSFGYNHYKIVLPILSRLNKNKVVNMFIRQNFTILKKTQSMFFVIIKLLVHTRKPITL